MQGERWIVGISGMAVYCCCA